VVFVILLFVVVKLFNRDDMGDHLLAAYISIPIYLISFQIIEQSGFFKQPSLVDQQKYKSSSVTHEQQQQLLTRLKSLMSDSKPFLKPDFSLPDLAEQLHVTVHQLSQVINEGLGRSFFEMTAEYRIEEAKRLLKEQINIKIEEIQRPEIQAHLVAEEIAEQLAKRASFRRTLKRAIEQTMEAGAKGISLFLVESDRPGYKRGRNLQKMGMQASDTAELFFENLRVPAASMLGPEGGGFAVLMKELPRERLTIAARSLTAAELAFSLTLNFVKDRTAFGQRVFDFQNSQFTLADIKTELSVGRAFYEDCLARMLSEGLDNTRSAMAKLWLTELEGRVMDRCVQLHGGAGYMSEYPISKLYTSARVHRIFGGTSEIMKYSIARQL